MIKYDLSLLDMTEYELILEDVMDDEMSQK